MVNVRLNIHVHICDYEGNALGKWGVPVLLSVFVVPFKCALTARACVTARRKQSQVETSASAKLKIGENGKVILFIWSACGSLCLWVTQILVVHHKKETTMQATSEPLCTEGVSNCSTSVVCLNRCCCFFFFFFFFFLLLFFFKNRYKWLTLRQGLLPVNWQQRIYVKIAAAS